LAFLLILAGDLMKGLVGTVFHAKGLFLPPAPVAGFADAPADNPGLGIAGYLDAAALRPETPGVMQGADQLAGLAPIAAVCVTRDSGHWVVSSKVENVLTVSSLERPLNLP
jgi:hypothetical protein